MTKIIDKETELNKLLTKDEKIKVLKYANEYLDSESSNDRQLKKKGNIFTGLTISRNDNIFKYIFKKIMNDFAEDINSELDSKKYTSTRPIRCSANGIFFISVHNPIFKYDYSNNQVKNFINFLILKPYIKTAAIKKACNIESMVENTLHFIDEIKEKITRSNLFKDKAFITFDLVKQNDFSYKLSLNYKYVIINYNMEFNIGNPVSLNTKYNRIFAALKESFIEGVLDSPRQINDKDADVFIRLCRKDPSIFKGVVYNNVVSKQINDLFDNNILSKKKAAEFRALILLNKLKETM